VGGFVATRRKNLRECGVFSLVGGIEINDSTFERAAAEEGPDFQRFQTIEEACRHADAVFICTPAHLHLEQAWVAARAGKAIFVEKPLAHKLEEARQLVEYCERNNLAHGHGLTLRHAPSSRLIKQLLDTGLCGKVVSAAATSMHSGGFAHPPDNWRFDADHNPGGPLFQCGIHKIDLLRWLFGEGEWAAAYTGSDVTGTTTEDSYVLMGRFGAVPCTLHCHYVTAYRHSLEIYGTKGNLYLTEYPARLLWQRRSGTHGVEMLEDLSDQLPTDSSESEALCEFAEAVRERRQPKTNGRDGLAALELVIEAANCAKSSQSNWDAAEPVAVDTLASQQPQRLFGKKCGKKARVLED